MSLEELAQVTRIPLRMLQCIEEDDFDKLPGEVFARGFLRAYARALGVDAGEVLAVYGQNRRVVEARPVSVAAPVSAIVPPERGRRFGIAIAVVILLILFTLALSIVLRPRQRDAQIELSVAPAPASGVTDVAAPFGEVRASWSHRPKVSGPRRRA
jgi:cytoskeletal protein RodZ